MFFAVFSYLRPLSWCFRGDFGCFSLYFLVTSIFMAFLAVFWTFFAVFLFLPPFLWRFRRYFGCFFCFFSYYVHFRGISSGFLDVFRCIFLFTSTFKSLTVRYFYTKKVTLSYFMTFGPPAFFEVGFQAMADWTGSKN